MAQAFHLGIAVEGDGPKQPNGGFDGGPSAEIYAAANATGSPVMFVSKQHHGRMY